MTIGSKPSRKRFYRLPPDTSNVLVEWQRFNSFRSARVEFWFTPCIYVFADRSNRLPAYVGKTTTGLGPRYSRAPETSQGALVFVAPLDPPHLEFVEHMTIFWGCPTANRRGHGTLPGPHIPIFHRFDGVDSWWGSGTTRPFGANYEGPLFLPPGITREVGTGRWIG